MKKPINRITGFFTLVVLFGTALFSCYNPANRVIDFPETDLTTAPLIPKPLEVTANGSGFALDQYTVISIATDNEDFEKTGLFLANKILGKTGLKTPVSKKKSSSAISVISINEVTKEALSNSEAYQLHIFEDSIALNASTAAGAFRGVQTLRQLIPEEGNSHLAKNEIWVVPTGKINDAPQYEYRGTMLDVSRHFFSVTDVKKYIDVLSYYKFNVLHLHLSDDQGWRIEIKSWPKLTEIGGSTEVGGEAGGFYTQKEYKDIVDYASAQHITIVPEIDMPGHTNAASVSYPFLNGNGEELELYTGTRVGFSTFDTRKDSVYSFIDDVVREIAAISPGPYFHIGGDESHVTKEEDYIYFVNRVEKIVQKYGKRMIGWDEVANADISDNSIAQIWASAKNAQTAVAKNMQVILSPAAKAYLDMKYDSLSSYGLTWAGYIPTDSAYTWSPEKYIDKKYVLGLEAPLWSETISNIDELEYMAFPRAIGYAELSWTTVENRSWEGYKQRLAGQVPFLERMNVKFYRSPRVNWEKPVPLNELNR